MKKILLIAAFSLMTFSVLAKEKVYTLHLTVVSAENHKTGDTTETGDVNRSIFGGIVHRDRHHEVVAKYVEASGDDGNVYELIPVDKKGLIVLPGTYSARFTDRNLIVLMPSGKEEKFQVVQVAKAAK
ncbi:MAG: hypothetical protein WA798_20250 [Candidatus Acidiferrum sp.]|jgi:hypothetical protein